ncbi:cytochrome c3 family protein [Shewanella mangrovi]|uniref:cytochrome c3 family protein n=1 Tax=Shewanella mangrovi TaxID=1515746 RepID=UPI000691206B|nr:cytochrome c3 family protein [Shewanella mangrovi]
MKITTLVFSMMMLCIGGVSIAHAQDFKWQQHHLQQGIKCASCHGNDVKAAIKNDTCLSCHGSYEKLGQQTKDMHLNVHQSPHFEHLECTACHTSHDQTTAFCQDCHGPIVRDSKFSKINK